MILTDVENKIQKSVDKKKHQLEFLPSITELRLSHNNDLYNKVLYIESLD